MLCHLLLHRAWQGLLHRHAWRHAHHLLGRRDQSIKGQLIVWGGGLWLLLWHHLMVALVHLSLELGLGDVGVALEVLVVGIDHLRLLLLGWARIHHGLVHLWMALRRIPL